MIRCATKYLIERSPYISQGLMFETIFPIKVTTHQSDVMTISIIVLTLDYKPMYGST